MTRQLALALPVRPARGRADFFVAPSNALALAAVEGWADWPGRRMLLVAADGAGKTHLAHVWAALCPGARIVTAADMAGADIPGLAAAPLAVEDADRLCGDAAGEEAFLHLYNLMTAQRTPLLVTAGVPPARWPVALPDLASRMQAMPLARLDPPCDALLSAVLVKLFADRQVAVAPAVIGWLVARMERSLAVAAEIVARLDAAALSRGSAITVRLAGQVLDLGGTPGQDDSPEDAD